MFNKFNKFNKFSIFNSFNNVYKAFISYLGFKTLPRTFETDGIERNKDITLATDAYFSTARRTFYENGVRYVQESLTPSNWLDFQCSYDGVFNNNEVYKVEFLVTEIPSTETIYYLRVGGFQWTESVSTVGIKQTRYVSVKGSGVTLGGTCASGGDVNARFGISLFSVQKVVTDGLNATLKNVGSSNLVPDILSNNAIDFQGGQYINPDKLYNTINRNVTFLLGFIPNSNINQVLFQLGYIKVGISSTKMLYVYVSGNTHYINSLSTNEYCNLALTFEEIDDVRTLKVELNTKVIKEISSLGAFPTTNLELFIGSDNATSNLLDAYFDYLVIVNGTMAKSIRDEATTYPKEFIKKCLPNGAYHNDLVYGTDFRGLDDIPYNADFKDLSYGVELQTTDKNFMAYPNVTKVVNGNIQSFLKTEIGVNTAYSYIRPAYGTTKNLNDGKVYFFCIDCYCDDASGYIWVFSSGEKVKRALTNTMKRHYFLWFSSNASDPLFWVSDTNLDSTFYVDISTISIKEIHGVSLINGFNSTLRTNRTQGKKGIQDIFYKRDSLGFSIDVVDYFNFALFKGIVDTKFIYEIGSISFETIIELPLKEDFTKNIDFIFADSSNYLLIGGNGYNYYKFFGGNNDFISSGNLDFGADNHLVYVIDIESNTIKVYINKVLKNTTAISGSITPTLPFTLRNLPNKRFNIHLKALTDEEIQKL